MEGPSKSDHDFPRWKLFVNEPDHFTEHPGPALVLMSPDHYKTSYALHFNFKASNNEVEYEALIAGLDLARELRVEAIIKTSMMIFNQVI